MATFVKGTMKNGNPVFINLDNVSSILPLTVHTGTSIFFIEADKKITVTETPEQIIQGDRY